MDRIVILGGGESGWGSALLAKKEGFRVFLSDSGTLAPKYRESLRSEGIDFEEGGHEKVFDVDASQVIKSPGIPETAAVVRNFSDRGIPVISEIEFAGRYSKGKTICITGSNGKTTTATLTFEILRQAGFDVALSGNIGDSYAAQVATCDKQWYVLELSSFQLDGMYAFKADTAVLLNITPDHLDRYDYDMGRYAASKMRVAANQGPDDILIYNGCDPVTVSREELKRSQATKLPFSTCGQGLPEGSTDGACLHDGRLTVNFRGKELSIQSGELGIHGKHNVANAMAASLAALAAGADPENIVKTLTAFSGVEHRMEYAGTVGGVRYVNDSKATNTDAAWFALEGTRSPIVWIAGGTDKGNDYSRLKIVARDKVKALVCMGTDNSKLLEEFADIVPAIFDTHSLEEAMGTASAISGAGDTVLLSPACASFDLFRNYEERGRLFKEWVDRSSGKKSTEEP